MENQVKRLESFPKFKNLIKSNSLKKEINKMKINMDLKLRLLFKESLSLLNLEGPEIDKTFETKMRMLYYQGLT